MSASAPGPPLDPIEPPERASGSLSEGGFQATDAEVADLLDPDRNASEVAELLANMDRNASELAALVLDPDRQAAELAALLEAHDL